jgi:hypothetical protein
MCTRITVTDWTEARYFLIVRRNSRCTPQGPMMMTLSSASSPPCSISLVRSFSKEPPCSFIIIKERHIIFVSLICKHLSHYDNSKNMQMKIWRHTIWDFFPARQIDWICQESFSFSLSFSRPQIWKFYRQTMSKKGKWELCELFTHWNYCMCYVCIQDE